MDDEVALLSEPWTAPIYMEVIKVKYYETINEKTFEQSAELVNVCDYLEGSKYPVKRFYFSLAKYLPPQHESDMICTDNSKQCAGWLDLKRDLCIAAHENGHTIASNGYVKSATGSKS